MEINCPDCGSKIYVPEEKKRPDDLQDRADGMAESIEGLIRNWGNADSSTDFDYLESCYRILCDASGRTKKDLKEISDL